MTIGITEKSSKKVAQIEEILRKKEIWQSELAVETGMSPQMIRYYINKYLKDKIIRTKIEGHNIKMKLK